MIVFILIGVPLITTTLLWLIMELEARLNG
jgi:hypothetical protein